MKKTPISQMIPLIMRGVGPPAALASGLLSPLALGASGDLDPTFGQAGISFPLFSGAIWSQEALDQGSLFGGGEDINACAGFYCGPQEDINGTLGTLSDTGTLASQSDAALLADTVVYDLAVQPDHKVVAVGRTVSQGVAGLIIFRLQSEGPLDTTFGIGGQVELVGDGAATALVFEPDGRIVVAGSKNNQLMVARLLPTGAFDTSFAEAGVFTGPASEFSAFTPVRTRLVRTADGAYRVTVNASGHCDILALTAEGVVDESFGAQGLSDLSLVRCHALALQPDGGLLIAGNENGKGAATRVLANGTLDAGFTAPAIPDALSDVTALALKADGSMLIAGPAPAGVAGATVLQLHANGTLDTLYGDQGSAWIDPPSTFEATSTTVLDLKVLSDGAVLAAGATYTINRPHAFAARLLGPAGADGPGVLGIKFPHVSAAEASQQAIVTVRRTGGHAGAVSVAYQTGDLSATADQDYTATSGRLTWADGDSSDREVMVPVADNQSPEESEFFGVTLSDAQGGGSLGTQNATVEILADGSPFGQFSVDLFTSEVTEGQVAELQVSRNFYSSGAVSVTLTPVAGSATADDFAADPIVLNWADGETAPITVTIPITVDDQSEGVEAFSVELSNPTGGALVGPRSTATISIAANAPTPPPSSGSGGGGAIGWLTLIWLGAVGLLRWVFRPLR